MFHRIISANMFVNICLPTMLYVLFIFLYISSCHSLYSVSVTVPDGFCLDIFPESQNNPTATGSQLELIFRVDHGDIQSSAYYFVSPIVYSFPDPKYTFSNNDNTLADNIVPRPLLLGTPIPLLVTTPSDNFDIIFDINQVIKWNGNGSIVAKCTATEQIHNHTVSPSHLLQDVTNHTFSKQIVFDLSNTQCLTTNESWFTCKPHVTVKLDIDCDGPCNELTFTTTTSTTSTVTTEIHAPTTTLASHREGNTDEFKFPLIAVAAVAALELVLIIGLCACWRRKPTSDTVERNIVEPEMYDDVQQNVVNNVTSQRQNEGTIDVNGDAEDDNYAAFAMDVIIDPAHLRSLNRNQ